MLLSRNVTNKIRFILDQCLLPILRDSKWLMRILITILYRRGAVDFMAFKDKAPFMTDEEYREIYQRVRPYDIRRETDCNTGCVKEILSSIVGDVILEVACGRGYFL